MGSKSFISAVAGTVLILLAAGCTVERGTLPKLKEEQGGSLHVVKSQKLKNVMHDLNNLVFERFYSEIDRDNMRVRYSRDIAQIVTSMSDDIKKIQQTGDELDLTQEQRLLFTTLALELEQEGENLGKIATEYRTESIRPTLDRLVNICNQCHSQFRDGRQGGR